jgi:hypothetical protein
MLLQTLLQLNILILATPALAGWTLLPPSHPGDVRAACVAGPGRTAEAVAPRTEQAEAGRTALAPRPQPAMLPPLIVPAAAAPVNEVAAFVAAPAAALTLFNPFPHAARAP